MPDGQPPLTLPQLPLFVARPSREAAPVDIVRRRWVLLGLVLLHVLGAVLVDRAMQMQPWTRMAESEQSFEVVFLDDAPTPLPAPAPAVATDAEPLARPQPSDTRARVAPVAPASPQPLSATPPSASEVSEPLLSPSTSVATAEPSVEPGEMRLFNDDGSPRLSKEAIDAAQPVVSAPDFAAPQPRGIAPIRSPIPYKPTRFDEYWVPSNETLGAEALRRVTVEKEFKTPWGTTWRCAWIIFIGGCGDVPPPAMKNPPKAPWETYQTEPEDTDRASDFLP